MSGPAAGPAKNGPSLEGFSPRPLNNPLFHQEKLGATAKRTSTPRLIRHLRRVPDFN
jgi:hypothetical protein